MEEQLQAWHEARYSEVTGPQGDVSLIALHELKGPAAVKEIAGRWQPAAPGEPGLTLTACAEDQLFIEGRLVEGTVTLIADETVVQTNNGISAMATSQPGSLHLLAIWDEHCPALRQFRSIASYPFNEQAVYTGKLETAAVTHAFMHSSDADKPARTHASIGVIHVEIAGQTYALRPFKAGANSIIVFRDATSAIETYGMGRMLVVELLADGVVRLDFNRAFLPPCAFSPYFNCPMPPPENRITTEIKAGEKNVILKELI